MDVRPGYKQTEVGVIPVEWAVAALEDITEKIMVGIASAATYAYRRYGVPLLRNQNIKAGYLDDTDVLFVDEDYEQSYRNKRLRAGDLLTARTGYPGMTCVVPEHYTSAQSFTTLITRPKSELVDSGFLSVFINSSQGQRFFDRSQIGGAQKNVNAGTLRKMHIPVPPLPEQRAIAAALSDVDALLDGLDRLIAKKRDLKQAAMQQLLTGQTRLPGFHGEWEMKRLDELGAWKGGMTPSMANPVFWLDGDVPWISSGDVKSVKLSKTSHSVTSVAVRQGATTLLPSGSIVLVTRSGILRKCLPVAITTVPMAINQDIKALIPSSGVNALFLLYTFLGGGDRILARCMKAGTTVESIEFRWLKAFTISIPHEGAEQQAIAAVLSDLDAELSALEARRDKTRDLKQAMMQELLTGRTRLVSRGGAENAENGQ